MTAHGWLFSFLIKPSCPESGDVCRLRLFSVHFLYKSFHRKRFSQSCDSPNHRSFFPSSPPNGNSDWVLLSVHSEITTIVYIHYLSGSRVRVIIERASFQSVRVRIRDPRLSTSLCISSPEYFPFFLPTAPSDGADERSETP